MNDFSQHFPVSPTSFVEHRSMDSDEKIRSDNIRCFFETDRIWPPTWQFTDCGKRFAKALSDVFWRLDEDSYYGAEDLWFVLDTGYLAISVPRDIICQETETPYKQSYDCVFISSRAWQLSDKALVGLLAHEIAHSFETRGEHTENEQAADALVRKWGFGAELDALHQPNESTENATKSV